MRKEARKPGGSKLVYDKKTRTIKKVKINRVKRLLWTLGFLIIILPSATAWGQGKPTNPQELSHRSQLLIKEGSGITEEIRHMTGLKAEFNKMMDRLIIDLTIIQRRIARSYEQEQARAARAKAAEKAKQAARQEADRKAKLADPESYEVKKTDLKTDLNSTGEEKK